MKIKSEEGIIGFKGLFDKNTGFISRLEIIENQVSSNLLNSHIIK